MKAIVFFRADQMQVGFSDERGRKTKHPHVLFPIVTLLEQEKLAKRCSDTPKKANLEGDLDHAS